jgi:GntR family transcriptional regulator/MocR family aminotransferase
VPCKGYFVAEIEGIFRQTITEDLQNHTKEIKRKFRYDFTPNGIDVTRFPYNIWRKLSKEVLLNESKDLFNSGHTQGEEELRFAIRQYLHQARGVNCSVDQIIVGAGNEYLLMLLSMILGKKCKIAFENPTYKQAYRLFASQGFETIATDMDKYGMRVDKLRELEAEMAYVMPSHQYPLGIVMPIKRRMELLQWAEEAEDRYIIEDDYDSEFRYKGKPIPALQGNDRKEKVIYLGTFSRAIAPAIRVSYMVLPKKLLKRYQEKYRFLSCTVPKVDQCIVSEFIKQGHFERHLNKMRAVYKNRHDALLAKLKPLMNVCTVSGEHAGVHLLLTFHNGYSEEELIAKAAAYDIKVYGLSAYDTHQTQKNTTILLGYANMGEKDIVQATEILCEIWR